MHFHFFTLNHQLENCREGHAGGDSQGVRPPCSGALIIQHARPQISTHQALHPTTGALATIFRRFARVKWLRMSDIMQSFWPDSALSQRKRRQLLCMKFPCSTVNTEDSHEKDYPGSPAPCDCPCGIHVPSSQRTG